MTHPADRVPDRPNVVDTGDAPGLMVTALAHAGRGWHVFPLRPGDKRPALRNDWERRATSTDRARIWQCWHHAPYNIGIACGPSNLVVVDLDQPKPGQTPPPDWDMPGINDGADVLAALCERHGQPFPWETHTVRTASGGMHLYFTAPLGAMLRNTAGRLGWLVDTRAQGGYVVAAGSILAGRGAYVTVNDTAPAPLPGWLAELLTTPTHPTAAASRMPDLDQRHAAGYAGAALRAEVQHVLDSRPGARNHTLNAAAFALGQLAAGGMLPTALVVDCLTAAGLTVGLTARECEATITSGMRAGARTPRGSAA
ncbi:RecA-family ATPase-like protein [Mycobacterium tuberculosis]|nr:RecA-family ATPase-like protein [Mycobacterium tuberculosis]